MRKKTKKWIIGLSALAIICLISCAFGSYLLSDSPLETSRIFDSPSGIFSGESGKRYVIDYGKKKVLILSETGELERTIDGGVREDGFYYASLITEGGAGNIYVADVLYSNKGTRLEAERIFSYSPNGTNRELIYEIDYSEHENPPLQYGRIHSMWEEGNNLYFVVNEGQDVQVHTLDITTGQSDFETYTFDNDFILSADADRETKKPVIVTRVGEIKKLNSEGEIEVLSDFVEGNIPWRAHLDGNDLYYTDIGHNTLLHKDLSTGVETAILESTDIVYTINVNANKAYTTDYMGYYVVDLQSNQSEYFADAPLANTGMRTLMWALVFVGTAAAIAALVLFLRSNRNRKKNITVQRVIIVLVVAISVATAVSYVTLSETMQMREELVLDQLSVLSSVMADSVDSTKLATIQSTRDYNNDTYLEIRAPLDELASMTYDNNLNCYYIVYGSDGEMIYGIMDYEDTTVSRYPLYPWGMEGYTDVLTDGSIIKVSNDVSSYGSWSFVLSPIYGENGDPFAIMEVGTNMDLLAQQNNELVIQVVLVVASLAVVLLMFILETLFYIEHREERRRLTLHSHTSKRFPIRAMVFLAFAADCMQDAFVAILANDLYTPVFGIPKSVGGALPMSAQVLMAALFAFAGGGMVKQMGAKKGLVFGFALQIIGSLTCAVIPTYIGLLFGKMFIGAGIGFITVSANTIAAAGDNDELSAEAFSVVNAGVLVGVTAGAGMGSLVLSFASASMVYYIGAAILAVGFTLAITGSDYREPVAAGKNIAAKERFASLRFFADKQVFIFLMLILMPFLIGISFREYFFPLYASENGMTEADIGRVYLLCGLLVIYAGPWITKTLITRLGAKKTVILSSFLAVISTLIFCFIPTLEAALFGVALFSTSISFGYAAQSTYYSSLKAVELIGDAKAMGVYSLFDNGGQTLGPILYGAALLLGYQLGLMLAGLFILVLLLIFIIVGRKNKGS